MSNYGSYNDDTSKVSYSSEDKKDLGAAMAQGAIQGSTAGLVTLNPIVGLAGAALGGLGAALMYSRQKKNEQAAENEQAMMQAQAAEMQARSNREARAAAQKANTGGSILKDAAAPAYNAAGNATNFDSWLWS